MKGQGEPPWYCNRCGETLYFDSVTFHWAHYLQGVRCAGVDWALREPPKDIIILGELALQLDTA